MDQERLQALAVAVAECGWKLEGLFPHNDHSDPRHTHNGLVRLDTVQDSTIASSPVSSAATMFFEQRNANSDPRAPGLAAEYNGSVLGGSGSHVEFMNHTNSAGPLNALHLDSLVSPQSHLPSDNSGLTEISLGFDRPGLPTSFGSHTTFGAKNFLATESRDLPANGSTLSPLTNKSEPGKSGSSVALSVQAECPSQRNDLNVVNPDPRSASSALFLQQLGSCSMPNYVNDSFLLPQPHLDVKNEINRLEANIFPEDCFTSEVMSNSDSANQLLAAAFGGTSGFGPSPISLLDMSNVDSPPRKRPHRSKSPDHVLGVHWDPHRKRWYAMWYDAETGKKTKRSFSIGKYGSSQARELAIGARRAGMEANAEFERQAIVGGVVPNITTSLQSRLRGGQASKKPSNSNLLHSLPIIAASSVALKPPSCHFSGSDALFHQEPQLPSVPTFASSDGRVNASSDHPPRPNTGRFDTADNFEPLGVVPQHCRAPAVMRQSENSPPPLSGATNIPTISNNNDVTLFDSYGSSTVPSSVSTHYLLPFAPIHQAAATASSSEPAVPSSHNPLSSFGPPQRCVDFSASSLHTELPAVDFLSRHADDSSSLLSSWSGGAASLRNDFWDQIASSVHAQSTPPANSRINIIQT